MSTTAQHPAANTAVVRFVTEDRDGEQRVMVPTWALTMDDFRPWSSSKGFPDRGKISFLGGGEIIVDMSPERLNSHSGIKSEIYRVLGSLVVGDDLGKFYPDGARFV